MPGLLKAQFINKFQSLFLQFSLEERWKKKRNQFNEWKFMHMETSNNSSNQSDFNNFFPLITLPSFSAPLNFVCTWEKKHLSVSGFWWQKWNLRRRSSQQTIKWGGAVILRLFFASILNCRHREKMENMSALREM